MPYWGTPLGEGGAAASGGAIGAAIHLREQAPGTVAMGAVASGAVASVACEGGRACSMLHFCSHPPSPHCVPVSCSPTPPQETCQRSLACPGLDARSRWLAAAEQFRRCCALLVDVLDCPAPAGSEGELRTYRRCAATGMRGAGGGAACALCCHVF